MPLLDRLDPTLIQHIMACNITSDSDNVMSLLRTGMKDESLFSIFMWLLDTLAEVAINESSNKMSAKNMSVVMTPNLLSVDSNDIQTALETFNRMTEFVRICIECRIRVSFCQEK